MALLKHRQITRADFDLLPEKDNNTEYTVVELNGEVSRYIGNEELSKKTKYSEQFSKDSEGRVTIDDVDSEVVTHEVEEDEEMVRVPLKELIDEKLLHWEDVLQDVIAGKDNPVSSKGIISYIANVISSNILNISIVEGIISYKYGTGEYKSIISVADLMGADGKEVSFDTTETHIRWRLGDGGWNDLVPFSTLKGKDGKEVTIDVVDGWISWKLGSGEWVPMIKVETLKGDKGDDGQEVSISIDEFILKWRLGTGSWNTLIDLSTLGYFKKQDFSDEFQEDGEGKMEVKEISATKIKGKDKDEEVYDVQTAVNNLLEQSLTIDDFNSTQFELNSSNKVTLKDEIIPTDVSDLDDDTNLIPSNAAQITVSDQVTPDYTQAEQGDTMQDIANKLLGFQGLLRLLAPTITIDSLTYETDGETATITGVASGGIGTLSYTLNGVTNTTGIFTVTEADTYTLSVTDAAGSGVETEDIQIVLFPYYIDLQTLHNSVSNDDFTESLLGYNAKFLPSCFKGNDSAHYTLPSTAMVFDDNDFEIEFDFFTTSLASIQYICGAPQSAKYRWYININTKGAIALYTEFNDVVRVISTVNFIITTNTHYIIRINVVRGEAGLNSIIVNGETATLPFNNEILNFDNSGNKMLMTYATNYNPGYNCSYIKTIIGGVLAEHYVLPSGYDVSGNNRHTTATNVVAANTSYMLNASRHLNVYGYSLWEHATLPDIQVPYSLAGSPLALTAGVEIPAGYSKVIDIPAVAGKWNMADCLVGFNEEESAATELDIFDRSNTTRQSAISRVSSYYDATNLATKSRYHITEITDPRIYFEFFNVGYAGKIFGKVTLELIDSTYYFKYYEEQLNYATDKTGNDQFRVMQYCNIDVFAE